MPKAEPKTWVPIEVDDILLAFPANIMHLMPPYADIPEPFKDRVTPWNQLVSTWFYRGLQQLVLTPKPGIDRDKALRHVSAIMKSYEPKHEHKEAACAYLLSLWFEEGATYTAAKPLVTPPPV